MTHVIGVGFGRPLTPDQVAGLHTLLGSDVTTEVVVSPRPDRIIERAQASGAAAIVFEAGKPETVRAVIEALPDIPTYGAYRQPETRRVVLGRNERGQSVFGEHTEKRFQS